MRGYGGRQNQANNARDTDKRQQRPRHTRKSPQQHSKRTTLQQKTRQDKTKRKKQQQQQNREGTTRNTAEERSHTFACTWPVSSWCLARKQRGTCKPCSCPAAGRRVQSQNRPRRSAVERVPCDSEKKYTTIFVQGACLVGSGFEVGRGGWRPRRADTRKRSTKSKIDDECYPTVGDAHLPPPRPGHITHSTVGTSMRRRAIGGMVRAQAN